MQVNELANQAGVKSHVVRYYTQIGLLSPTRDPNNHYRDYRASDVYRVRFILRAKWLGFTLKDVRKILSDADAGRSPCAEVRELVIERAQQNHVRLEELQRLQGRVEEAVAVWQTLPNRTPDHESLCHLIDSVVEMEEHLT